MLANAIGMAGVALVILCYAMLATGRWRSDEPRYPLVNILGTLGIIVSLMAHWNLASFVAQVAWILVSLLGLVRIYRRRA